MITKFNKFNLITEDPDEFEYNGEWISLNDDDAIPFFCILENNTTVDEIYFGENSSCHSDIIFDDKLVNDRSYPGRMWLDRKIMTFWVYPDDVLFKSIIHKIEKELDIKIFNNDWKIEVIEKEDGIKRRKDSEDIYVNSGDFEYAKIIPLDDYAGSEDVPEERQIMHLMNWKEKELARKIGKLHFGSFGSRKTAWDTPHNIKWRQAIYQENKKNDDN
jgi:hypothetical protein